MAVASRPRWLRPALALAVLGASAVPVASGVLLMRDVKLSNFCNERAVVGPERALRDARIRRFHDRAAFPVGGCLALAVAFGGSAGASFQRRWRRWAIAGLATLAVGGFLAADFTGKKEAWQTLSPGLSGWSKLLPPGSSPGQPQISITRPECDPAIRPEIERRVGELYWTHVLVGFGMAVATAVLGLLGMTWKREEVVR